MEGDFAETVKRFEALTLTSIIPSRIFMLEFNS